MHKQRWNVTNSEIQVHNCLKTQNPTNHRIDIKICMKTIKCWKSSKVTPTHPKPQIILHSCKRAKEFQQFPNRCSQTFWRQMTFQQFRYGLNIFGLLWLTGLMHTNVCLGEVHARNAFGDGTTVAPSWASGVGSWCVCSDSGEEHFVSHVPHGLSIHNVALSSLPTRK